MPNIFAACRKCGAQLKQPRATWIAPRETGGCIKAIWRLLNAMPSKSSDSIDLNASRGKTAQFPYLVYDIGSEEREITRIPPSFCTDHRGDLVTRAAPITYREIRFSIVAFYFARLKR